MKPPANVQARMMNNENHCNPVSIGFTFISSTKPRFFAAFYGRQILSVLDRRAPHYRLNQNPPKPQHENRSQNARIEPFNMGFQEKTQKISTIENLQYLTFFGENISSNLKEFQSRRNSLRIPKPNISLSPKKAVISSNQRA